MKGREKTGGRSSREIHDNSNVVRVLGRRWSTVKEFFGGREGGERERWEGSRLRGFGEDLELGFQARDAKTGAHFKSTTWTRDEIHRRDTLRGLQAWVLCRAALSS